MEENYAGPRPFVIRGTQSQSKFLCFGKLVSRACENDSELKYLENLP
jgi:hypothetical protein